MLLLSDDESEKEQARDLLSNLMTTHRGEYVLRLGRRPLHSTLFNPDPSSSADDWIGTPRSDDELKRMVDETVRIVEDVGGRVRIEDCFTLAPLTEFSIGFDLVLMPRTNT